MFIFIVALILVLIIILKGLKWFVHKDCKSNVCLTGKTALVTGGNKGIGYQIVLGLLRRGCRVIIAAREQNENLLEDLIEETQNRNVVFEHVDLSCFKSVRKLANKIKKSEDKLDILVHNAGIGREVSEHTEDGLDIVLQVNYFSSFLLTHLLVDLLNKAKGRIVFTSSIMAFLHNFSLEKLKLDEINSKCYFYHYQNSKLCLIIAGDMFAEKLKAYGITSNTYAPWIVQTSIFQQSIQSDASPTGKSRFFIWMLIFLAWLTGHTPEQGAQTAIHLACAKEVENVTGEYFFKCNPMFRMFRPRLTKYRKEYQAIWEMTEELVNLAPEERLN